MLSKYQSFTIDKSMIKKIYSWEEPNREYNKTYFSKDNEQYNFDSKQQQVRDVI